METLRALARALWASGWGMVHLIVAASVAVLGFGIPLLWIVPGVAARGRGRSWVNALGWVAWFGPFGLIAALRTPRSA